MFSNNWIKLRVLQLVLARNLERWKDEWWYSGNMAACRRDSSIWTHILIREWSSFLLLVSTEVCLLTHYHTTEIAIDSLFKVLKFCYILIFLSPLSSKICQDLSSITYTLTEAYLHCSASPRFNCIYLLLLTNLHLRDLDT